MYDEVMGIAINIAIASQIEDETVLDRMVEFYYRFAKDEKVMTLEEFRSSVRASVGEYPPLTEDEVDILVAESGMELSYVLPKLTEPQQREYLGLLYDALAGLDAKFDTETDMTKEAFILEHMTITKVRNELERKEEEDDKIDEALTVMQEAIVKRGLSKDFYDKVVEVGAALYDKPLDAVKDYFDEVYKAMAA